MANIYNIPARTPTTFFYRNKSGWYLYGAVIPIGFIMLAAAGIRVMSVASVDSVIVPINILWPPAKENFARMNQAGFPLHAVNYIAFIFTMFAFNLCVLVAIYRRFLKSKNWIEGFKFYPDGLFLILGFFWYVSLAHTDLADFQFSSPAYFYVEKIGFFYLREYVIFAGIWMWVTVLSIALTRFFSLIHRH